MNSYVINQGIDKMRTGLLFLFLIPQLLLADSSLIPKSFISGSMQEIVAGSSGKPMIVNFWSVDCLPCHKELAMWKQLSALYPQMNLVLVSIDSLEVSNEVVEVLQESGVADFDIWQFADTHTQRLRYEIDKSWYGEIPRTYFYSQSGDVLAVSGLIKYDMAEQWLAQYYH